MDMETLQDDSFQLNQIPILHVRGTHRMIGYATGRQFKNMIDDLLSRNDYLNNVVIPIYETPEGAEIYEESLELCKAQFPKYVEELEGIAAGAKIPFYKIFLLHIDTLIAPLDPAEDDCKCKLGTGCTSILSDSEQILLGHTEDACPEFLNNVYIIAAEVISETGEVLEKFTTLTYAGHLPGYTMGFNAAGLVYSVNTIFPKKTFRKRTPRTFLARAILGAENYDQVMAILRKYGTSDPFSLNLAFYNNGSPTLLNVEIGANHDGGVESELNILTVKRGDVAAHGNKFLRITSPENQGFSWECSKERLCVIAKAPKPDTVDKIRTVLSDTVHPEYSIYREGKGSYIRTVAVGIFDILKRTWSIYMQRPDTSEPVVVISMN